MSRKHRLIFSSPLLVLALAAGCQDASQVARDIDDAPPELALKHGDDGSSDDKSRDDNSSDDKSRDDDSSDDKKVEVCHKDDQTLSIDKSALDAHLKHGDTEGACDSDDDSSDDDSSDDTGPVDSDGDGYSADTDCDDGDSAVNPEAVELCDGVDNDCDGTVDVGAEGMGTWHADADGDGHGDVMSPVVACEQPEGTVETTTDCDDTLAGVNPDAEEICDGIDNDCDGTVDVGAEDVSTWHADADGDGHGDAMAPLDACEQPDGHVETTTDCDDADEGVSPDAVEVAYDGLDNDCNPETADDDLDEDGFSLVDDCDDLSAAVFPGAQEIPYDGIDNDCDPESADDDLDGDGAVSADDCDDADAAVSPDADEVAYDGVDNDCDVDTPDDDLDADGVPQVDDCDDADAGRSPTLAEVHYDGIDNDCDPATADDDLDNDGFEIVDDCEDQDAAINPDAEEILGDGVDNDCDEGTADEIPEEPEEEPEVEPVEEPESTWYVDVDGDGHGDSDSPIQAVTQPDGAVANGDDCDDAQAVINPAAEEICDGIDNDCDGEIDVAQATLTGRVSLSLVPARLVGTVVGELAGVTMGSAGDIDGDGDDELILGAVGESSAGVGAGAAYLVNPITSGEMPLTSATGKLTGEIGADMAGSAVAGIGDWTGDGIPDVAVGAPGHNTDDGTNDGTEGVLYIVSGKRSGSNSLGHNTAKIIANDHGDFLGSAVDNAGDTNGDGLTDIIIGAVGMETTGDYSGGAYVLSQRVTGEVDVEDVASRIHGGAEGDFLGSAVAGIGDVNGDGFDDVAVGAFGRDDGGVEGGALYVFHGPVDSDRNIADADATILGATGELLGFSVSKGGDLNGDGVEDLLVGAPSYGGAGTAYVFYGPISGHLDVSQADARLVGENLEDEAGTAVAGVGDMNGDGHDDVIIGAPGYDSRNAGELSGAAYVVFGPVGGEVDLANADVRLAGEFSGDGAGITVEPAGDVDGDGRADALIGTVGYNTTSSLAGVAYLLTGELIAERGMGSLYYADSDGDGWGDEATAMRSCEPSDGLVEEIGDCDDADAGVNPGADEVCDDIDNNCDGAIDEERPGLEDCDGLVDADTGLDDDTGSSDTGGADTGADTGVEDGPHGEDCECDDDIDTGTECPYQDPDRDVPTDPGEDDDDESTDDPTDDDEDSDTPTDDDSDTPTDDDDDTTGGGSTGGGDGGDGGGEGDDGSDDPTDDPSVDEPTDGDSTGGGGDGGGGDGGSGGGDDDSTDEPVDDVDTGDTGEIEDTGDVEEEEEEHWGDCEGGHEKDPCDGTGMQIDCGEAECQPEMCDGIDNDGDGEIDEYTALDAQLWFMDSDADGHGDLYAGMWACYQPEGFVLDSEDCDDADGDVHPLADEICDGLDNDCDDLTDDDSAIDAIMWYVDGDADGFGGTDAVFSCEALDGFVLESSDCDDGDEATWPGADETCDGADNDCDGELDEDAIDPLVWQVDVDEDGIPALGAATVEACEQPEGYAPVRQRFFDCDDTNDTVYPRADELCDGLDNNCNRIIDEPSLIVDGTTWFADRDGDGWGDENVTRVTCEQPEGFTAEAGDCLDGLATVHPDADEICDGIDQDCDGELDEDAVDAGLWYADGDGDGFGGGSAVEACEQPEGHSADASDCDDDDATVSPAGVEVCDSVDNDCDGERDEGAAGGETWYADVDGDGYGDAAAPMDFCDEPTEGYVANAEDCDDADAEISPAADELCDGIDNNCDAEVDESAIDATSWYADEDGDGYGDGGAQRACEQPEGLVDNADDCDDADVGVNPGAAEVCDSIDNNCDGENNEAGAEGMTAQYADADGDGFGDESTLVESCVIDETLVIQGGDCDDSSERINPDADEVCDEVDNNCDGSIDNDAVDQKDWYVDADGDGHGAPDVSQLACTQPEDETQSWVRKDDDCDDADVTVAPGAEELCDGIDNDCDGETDEENLRTYYVDADGDGDGSDIESIETCERPEGFIGNKRDCDDSDPLINTDAAELCDGIDNDCDGDLDADADDALVWYADADEDGYGHKHTMLESCEQPEGYIAEKGDCDDSDATINPDAVEWCDGVDNDCDDKKDEDDAADALTWFADADEDGFGDPGETTLACEMPNEYVDNTEDCDDGDNAIYPNAIEWCGDGVDNDCDGVDQTCGLYGNVAMGSGGAAYGHGYGHNVGDSVASAGDVDGDGHDDIIVGAADWDDGTSVTGAAYIVYGPLTSDMDVEEGGAVRIKGEANNDDAGEGVAGLGDINNDGFADVIVGAPRNDYASPNAGAAYVMYGPVDENLDMPHADATLLGVSSWGRLGHAVSGAGDVNGDGSDDIMVSAWYESVVGTKEGAVYLFYSAVSGDVSAADADVKFVGADSQDYLGSTLASAGDLDGDGHDDLLLSAYKLDTNNDDIGATYVFNGGGLSGEIAMSSADARILGEANGDESGTTMVGGGDVNGDGYNDIVIGAPKNDEGGSNAGASYVVFGPISGESDLSMADAKLMGERSGDAAGTSVLLADLNGDSYGDVIVGAPGNSALASDDGAVYVTYGPFTGTLSLESVDAKVAGENAGEQIGTHMAAGEATGDGYLDLILGAPNNDDNGASSGAVFVLGGGPLPVPEEE